MATPRRLPPAGEARDLVVERRMTVGALRGQSRLVAPNERRSMAQSRDNSTSGVATVRFAYDSMVVP